MNDQTKMGEYILISWIKRAMAFGCGILLSAQSPWQPITFRQDLPKAAKAVAWLAKNWFLHAIYFSHYEATDPTLGTKQESLSSQIIIFQNSQMPFLFLFFTQPKFLCLHPLILKALGDHLVQRKSGGTLTFFQQISSSFFNSFNTFTFGKGDKIIAKNVGQKQNLQKSNTSSNVAMFLHCSYCHVSLWVNLASRRLDLSWRCTCLHDTLTARPRKFVTPGRCKSELLLEFLVLSASGETTDESCFKAEGRRVGCWK